eukprot:SAG11_NODE_49_length_19996_cov_13.133588_7_plen_40_part_00
MYRPYPGTACTGLDVQAVRRTVPGYYNKERNCIDKLMEK